MSTFRWKIWAMAGLGAVAAWQFVERDGAVVPAAGARGTPSLSASADGDPGKPVASRLIDGLRRDSIPPDRRGDLFAGQSWTPAVAPAPSSAVAAPAEQPVFPYRYAGRLKQGAGQLIYLARGSDLVGAGVGDVLDGVWRIDRATDERIDVTFVPAGNRLSLALEGLAGKAAPAALAPRQVHSPAAATRMAAVPVPGPSEARSQPGFARAFVPSGTGGTQVVTALAGTQQANPGATSPGAPLGNQAPTPSGTLGSDAPSAGSMPIGPAPTGSGIRAGPTPTGRLGL